MIPRSKLPQVGTTIFSVMSRRAAELGAVNLGQGFPDYDIDTRLTELVCEAMRGGYNQYAPMPGLPALRAQIARKIARQYALQVDPDSEITITGGAAEALFSGIQALVGAGDEAIVFDPAYDAYAPAIELTGARCLHVPLQPPHFRYDWERVRALLGPRTRLVIVNTPHNPACTCLRPGDLQALAELTRDRPIFVISDEVYEHVIFDERRHESLLRHEELRERTLAVFSFGKMLHATGLRVGYAVAPPAVTAELRKVHQFNTFAIATCLQQGIARYLEERPDCGPDLGPFFAARRDRLATLLEGSGLVPLHSEGSYFQLIDYGAVSQEVDTAFADELLTEAGVATIPLSVFYREPPPMTLLRLCFAKRDETLVRGAEQLSEYARTRSS